MTRRDISAVCWQAWLPAASSPAPASGVKARCYGVPAICVSSCLGAGRVALLGEAAGWVSPSSAEGFSFAFNSAIALAEALAAGLDGAVARYTTQTQPLRRAIGREIVKSAGMFTPWLRRFAFHTNRSPSTELAPAILQHG